MNDADALFGKDPTPAEPTTGAPASGRTDIDERTLYGDAPLPGDNEMFKPSTALRPTFLAHREALLDAGYSLAELQTRHRAYVALAVDTGLPTAVVEQFYDLDVAEILRAARAGDDGDTPAPDTGDWFEASRRQTRETYGAERGERLLGHVDTFLGQHPPLRARLEATGYRYHPDVVEALVDHVRRLHE